jgi:hypothetical protein
MLAQNPLQRLFHSLIKAEDRETRYVINYVIQAMDPRVKPEDDNYRHQTTNLYDVHHFFEIQTAAESGRARICGERSG